MKNINKIKILTINNIKKILKKYLFNYLISINKIMIYIREV